jgi:hypothetical protein
MLPGVICNRKINSLEVIGRNCLRFRNTNRDLYEFGPSEKRTGDFWQDINNPSLKIILE